MKVYAAYRIKDNKFVFTGNLFASDDTEARIIKAFGKKALIRYIGLSDEYEIKMSNTTYVLRPKQVK